MNKTWLVTFSFFVLILGGEALAQNFPNQTVYAGAATLDAGPLTVLKPIGGDPCYWGLGSCPSNYTWVDSNLYMHNNDPGVAFCPTTDNLYPFDGGACMWQVTLGTTLDYGWAPSNEGSWNNACSLDYLKGVFSCVGVISAPSLGSNTINTDQMNLDGGVIELINQLGIGGLATVCTYGSPGDCAGKEFTELNRGLDMHNSAPSVALFNTSSSLAPSPWDGGGLGYQFYVNGNGIMEINGVRDDNFGPQTECLFDYAHAGVSQFACVGGIGAGSFQGPQLDLDARTVYYSQPENYDFYFIENTDPHLDGGYVGAFIYGTSIQSPLPTIGGPRNLYFEDPWNTYPGDGFQNVDFQGVEHITNVPDVNGITIGQYGDAGQLPLPIYTGSTYVCANGSIGYDLLDNVEYVCISQVWKTVTHS